MARIRHIALTTENPSQTAEFYKLGRGKLICISAHQNRGEKELFDLIRERLPKAEGPNPSLEVTLKLAIVGRRNTGKSTFVNTLAKAERMIVSEVPGTTRDSVDVRFERAKDSAVRSAKRMASRVYDTKNR